jgi:OOP family OmpA-OmpF porin
MTMKKMLSAIAIGALLASANAMAGKNVEPVESEVVPVLETIPFYIGIGGSWGAVSNKCPCAHNPDKNRKKDSTYGGIIRIGYDFNPFFGIEARALRTSFESDFSELTHYGIYAKPQYHITNDINVYALAGYGHTLVHCTKVKSGSKDFVKNGFSYGAGIEYDLSSDRGAQGDAEEGWGLFLDWQNLANKENPLQTSVNVVSAGVTYDF